MVWLRQSSCGRISKRNEEGRQKPPFFCLIVSRESNAGLIGSVTRHALADLKKRERKLIPRIIPAVGSKPVNDILEFLTSPEDFKLGLTGCLTITQRLNDKSH